MEIVDRKIKELIASEYNPRVITEKQFNDLVKSLKKLDILEPAVINMNEKRKNIIISGHQRIKAAGELGFKTYPCLEVDFGVEKEREANIRMNKAGGQWDFDALANFFDVDDLKYYGFEDRELGFSSFGEDDLGNDNDEKGKEDKKVICPECKHEFKP
jgi:ParB-like chromosome segregation protein Spo0J